MQIRDFIRNEWAEYADYDNRRKLPHIMDGLKITQRKALYTAISMPKNTPPLRVSQFASKAGEKTLYHHGDDSMISAIVGLAQDHPGCNNYPLLQKHGQFGSRLSGEAAAPRYIKVELHDNWHRFFKSDDQEIVEYLYEENDQVEPKYFIPIIPVILLNGIDGIGNGYRSYIMHYDIPSIVKGIKEIIKGGTVKTKLVPTLIGWTGNIEKVDRQVIFTGNLKVENSRKIHITELPPKYDNDGYKELLNGLIERNIIKDYQNKSTEAKWDWHVDVSRETASLPMDKLLDVFGLIEKNSENFVGWGMDDKEPMTFESAEALLEYWYVERMKLYQSSIENQITQSKKAIIRANMRMRFIRWCLKNDIRKLSRNEFIERCVNEIKSLPVELAKEFIAMPMYRITTDEIAKLEKEMDELVVQLDELENTKPIQLMERNLKTLN